MLWLTQHCNAGLNVSEEVVVGKTGKVGIGLISMNVTEKLKLEYFKVF